MDEAFREGPATDSRYCTVARTNGAWFDLVSGC